MNTRSLFVRAASMVALALGLAPGTAVADPAFPAKQVTLVAAYPPGGTVDLLARAVAGKLSKEWGHPVVVENRPGASGMIGSQQVAKSPPDGYTLMVVPITHVTNSSLFAKVPYDPIADFTAISLLASQPIMLVVNKSFPAKSADELIKLAKASPGKFNCGSGGNGTSQHLACELFKNLAGVDIRHVPYKGNAAAMTDVIGGQIEMLFDQMATAVPHVKGDRVRALAVSTAKRSPAMPEIPTLAESGLPNYETEAWFGLVGPAGVPLGLAERIQKAFAKALNDPDNKERLSAQGLTLVGGPPREFDAYLKSELKKWSSVINAAGIRLD